MRREVLAGLAVGSLAVVAACTPVKPPVPEPDVVEVPFEFTGGAQTWQVPADVDEVTVTAYGAAGGQGIGQATHSDGPLDTGLVPAGTGGLGGAAIATIAVVPEEILEINVGGRGADADLIAQAAGGFNGGANGPLTGTSCGDARSAGGAGGGASDVRRGAAGLADRLVVAGGAGGGGGPLAFSGSPISGPIASVTDGGSGGNGGGLVGVGGGGAFPGGGGSQSAGGTAGGFFAQAGDAGIGGTGGSGSACGPAGARSRAGGGGGGGLFGGGGGAGPSPEDPDPSAPGGGGGGGGSGFGPSGTDFQTGGREGNGRVVITYVEP